MRSLLFAALALASTATAQTVQNFFGLHTCTNFTTRGALGANAGDNLLQIRSSHFSGIAHDNAGGGTTMTGFRHVLQDQNAATVENYNFIVRGDNAGAPDCSATGLLLNVGPFASPGGTGTLAWIITGTLATPSTLLPLCSTYYIGLALPANATWTGDGLSTHMGSYYILNGTQAGNPAPNAPQIAHNCLNGAPVPITSNRTYRYEIGTPAAVLNLYNEDPTLTGNTANCVATTSFNIDYGVGGMWPENGGGRIDGLGCRVDDPANAGGLFICFLGVHAGLCPGVPIGFLAAGALYLNPAAPLIVVAQGALSAAPVGRGQSAIIPPNALAPHMINNQGIFDFQAFTIGPSFALPGRMTNRASAFYLP
jgi:hypothetical protein